MTENHPQIYDVIIIGAGSIGVPTAFFHGRSWSGSPRPLSNLPALGRRPINMPSAAYAPPILIQRKFTSAAVVLKSSRPGKKCTVMILNGIRAAIPLSLTMKKNAAFLRELISWQKEHALNIKLD